MHGDVCSNQNADFGTIATCNGRDEIREKMYLYGATLLHDICILCTNSADDIEGIFHFLLNEIHLWICSIKVILLAEPDLEKS